MDEMTEMRREYWADVKTIAEEIESEVRAGTLTAEEAWERLDEACDNQWSIYTYRAKCVVAFISAFPDALSDELGPDELVRDGSLNWSGMAYMAMRADIQAQLGDLEEIAQEGEASREADEDEVAE